jgi:hypothetical protein
MDGSEKEWISMSGDNEDFKEYENRVERFLANLKKTVSELHEAGHLDTDAKSALWSLARNMQLEP